MNSFNARLHTQAFVSRLKLDPSVKEHVILCPFHPDTGRSFSVNLDKAVFFCFGGCAEPRGGGAIAFVQKWALVKDGKTLTRSQAYQQLRHVGSFQSAQDGLREYVQADLLRFAQTMRHVYADRVRELETLIVEVNSEILRIPADDDPVWDTLEDLYKLRSDYEWAWSICQRVDDLSPRAIARAVADPDLIAIHRQARALGDWDFGRSHSARVFTKIKANVKAQLRKARVCPPEPPSRPTRTPVR